MLKLYNNINKNLKANEKIKHRNLLNRMYTSDEIAKQFVDHEKYLEAHIRSNRTPRMIFKKLNI